MVPAARALVVRDSFTVIETVPTGRGRVGQRQPASGPLRGASSRRWHAPTLLLKGRATSQTSTLPCSCWNSNRISSAASRYAAAAAAYNKESEVMLSELQQKAVWEG